MEEKKIQRNIFTLGLVSLFTDISSEMIYPLLPIFLSSVLGVGQAFIGLIEGIAESTASILKVFSGWFSDKLKKRKPIIFAGYSLSTIGKPILYFAANGFQVLFVRFIDRVGKGLRTSPRDALVADSTSAEHRGRAFGIQRAMDRAGAVVGPLLAFLILPLVHNNYRKVFLFSFFPGLIAVLIIIFFVKEKSQGKVTQNPNIRLTFKGLGKDFKLFIIIISIFTLGNSSNAFLLLRAKSLGVSIVMIPIFWMVFNLVSSLSAIPFGVLSDKIGRRKTIIFSFLVYSVVYFGFAFSHKQLLIWFFIGLYGLYDGISEGVLRAYVSDVVTDRAILGTAYGVFNTAIGIFMLPASLLFGILWQAFGPVVAFGFGGILSLISAVLFPILFRK